jgi:hypothetical protein
MSSPPTNMAQPGNGELFERSGGAAGGVDLTIARVVEGGRVADGEAVGKGGGLVLRMATRATRPATFGALPDPNGASAPASSTTLRGRASGSFSRHDITVASSASGTSGLSQLMGAGWSAAIIANSVS